MILIISEKEEAARVKADILSGGLFDERVVEVDTKKGVQRVTYFQWDDNIIIPARGHLVTPTLNIRTAKFDDLPVTELKWAVSGADRPRVNVIKRLAEHADEVIVATDYDREGEVIGYNIVARILKITHDPSEIRRAYYSALTSDFVRSAFNNLKPMNESLLTQGLARNIADTIIGLNLTKALTLIFKSEHKQMNQAVSLGRVQSPVLNHINSSTGVHVGRTAWISGDDRVDLLFYIEVGDKHYDIQLGDKPISQVTVEKIEEVEEEIQQAQPCYNTNDAMVNIPLDPNLIMDTLENLYLSRRATYPRTESRWLPEDMLKEIEDTIRQYDDIPDSFTHTNYPVKDSEDEKMAITLTPLGVEALLTNKLRGREEFVAKILYSTILKSFAPPIKVKKYYVTFSYNGEEIKVLWSTKAENLDDCVISDLPKFNIRPDLTEGNTYNVITVSKHSNYEWAMMGKYSPTAYLYGDKEIIEWMIREELGTEATRQMYPSLLRQRHYTTINNLPTLFGSVVSEIIEKIGLTQELTSSMERRINQLSRLGELEEFTQWVIEVTTEFIDNLKNGASVNFTCPDGHAATLINTKNGLFMRCDICQKWYGL